ncbi:MAG: CoA transferase [Hyphomonadaceae bacterium]
MYDLLKGLRVVEGAAFIAGPSCGLHLAQMGADVIRFDTIGGGPDFKRWPLAPNGFSFYWEGLNKGKKSVALDLASPRGRELAVAIAAAPGDNAGMFVTNYPLDGFLSYEKLKAARSDIICVRVTGWADGSPAMDYTVHAASGLPHLTGPVGASDPINQVLPAWDLLTGAHAAFALMAAERARRATGEGRDIRMPLSDMVASTLSHIGMVGEALSQGGDRERVGNGIFGAFGRDFVTADGERLMLVAISVKQWRGALSALGLSDEVAALEAELGVSFARDESLRYVHRDRLYPLFERAVAQRSLTELGQAFDASGVTWSKYQTTHEAVTADRRLFADNPIFQTMTGPTGVAYPASGPAASFIGLERLPMSPAPRLGQHTDEVLANVLGLSAGAIGKLHDEGVVAS